MPSLRRCNGLPDFSAAVRALIDKIDSGHIPVGLDLPDIHRRDAYAAGADHRSHLGFVLSVMLNVGWHFGSPSYASTSTSTQRQLTSGSRNPIMNSLERTKNASRLLVSVAFL